MPLQHSFSNGRWHAHMLSPYLVSRIRIIQLGSFSHHGPSQCPQRPDKLFEADRAVRQLLEIVDGARLEDNGRFIAWDKSDLPW